MRKNIIVRFIFTFVHIILTLFTVIFVVRPIYLRCKKESKKNPNKKFYEEFAFISKKILKALGTSFRSYGQIPETGENYIVICDHKNWLDAFPISAYFNGTPGVVFLDEKMFKYPILNFFLEKVDAIAINKKSSNGWQKFKDISDAFDKAIEVLNKGIHLFMFPEGHRSPDGELGKIKHGAAELAIRTRKKILVLAFAGMYEFSNKSTYLFTPSKVRLHTAAIIDYKGDSKKELSEIIKVEMQKAIEEAKKLK